MKRINIEKLKDHLLDCNLSRDEINFLLYLIEGKRIEKIFRNRGEVTVRTMKGKFLITIEGSDYDKIRLTQLTEDDKVIGKKEFNTLQEVLDFVY